jgi:hypothetical protein
MMIQAINLNKFSRYYRYRTAVRGGQSSKMPKIQSAPQETQED